MHKLQVTGGAPYANLGKGVGVLCDSCLGETFET